MNILRKIYDFYATGFRSMTVGRQLWLLIIVKVVILFAIIKVFSFPDELAENADGGDKGQTARREILSRGTDAPQNTDITNINPD